MPDLATAVTVVDACGRAGVPSLLISGPGMGKSSLVRALAASEGVLCETVLGGPCGSLPTSQDCRWSVRAV